MTDNNVEKDILTIPLLDGTNYSKWSVRMTILLWSKELLDICEKEPEPGVSAAATNLWTKASYNAVSLITPCVSHKVFINVIKINTTNPYLLWTKLEDKYASKKATNRGCVWIDLPRSSYQDKVLWKLEDFYNNSNLQESHPLSSASALISENSGPFKITHYCANGKHNSKCTNHSKEECYAENPHLQPACRDERRRPFSSQNVSAHISTAHELITGQESSSSTQDLIIDCGATHNMFHNKNLFLSFSKINCIKVSTSDSSSTLSAIGLGTVKLFCNKKPLILENSLFVP
ncbi:hypothetical protein O181_060387 [Austropuccinia psidii MF-1]|uniref:DUF4219 domain-containing protein n=1 Tax=Austropuccinia psidii MF-1 TaxID=1389203 RepID=A0A9Q3EIK9_9BASI|nr:hypothetical protein [Austropuccinia psidii MF-1]